MKGANGQLRSSVIIARLLDSEGFTDYVANQIDRYWKHNAGLTERQKEKLKKVEKSISDFMADKSEGEKMVLGRFIGLHKKMAFDTGLKMGLAAFAVETDKMVEDETAFMEP